MPSRLGFVLFCIPFFGREEGWEFSQTLEEENSVLLFCQVFRSAPRNFKFNVARILKLRNFVRIDV